ncbi:tRNA:m(4)X modification enzyme [Citrus sinensis]|uniref:tRNA:m(4)X modification enzyme n=1 Tax=Citrus sinensis TaxID=2711 RepID=A0ACB8KTJ4_CITSI|nr:tRNA:m(4)X modification enzyme [Citrus sinensis]
MEETRCKFWLPKKNRFCSNARLNDSSFSVLKENLDGHVKRCPLLKQVRSLSQQPFYHKGINAGKEDDEEELGAVTSTAVEDNVTSEMKRNAVHSMTVPEFCNLIKKIESVHALICNGICDSFKIPEACGMWIKREIDRKLPFQEKHVTQQASILGNLEEFGVLKNSVGVNQDDEKAAPAVVEFGAGRGYLTQMLADCYGTKRVFLADRSLRQKESLTIERLRIDIEDLDLSAVESLRNVPYLAIGKHLCGPATDLALRCCLMEQYTQDNVEHCSSNNYIRDKKYMLNLGITKEEFHAISWFTSWAVDADHGLDHLDFTDSRMHLESIEKELGSGLPVGVEDIVRNMKAVERAVLGFMCKQIIDVGRLMWMKEQGLEAELVKYVPSSISPENHLLIAKLASLS